MMNHVYRERFPKVGITMWLDWPQRLSMLLSLGDRQALIMSSWLCPHICPFLFFPLSLKSHPSTPQFSDLISSIVTFLSP